MLDPRLRIIRGDNTRDPSAPARVLRCLQITRKEDAQGAAPVPAHPEIRDWLVDYASDSGEQGESTDGDSEHDGLGISQPRRHGGLRTVGIPADTHKENPLGSCHTGFPAWGPFMVGGFPRKLSLGTGQLTCFPWGYPMGRRGAPQGDSLEGIPSRDSPYNFLSW